MALTMILFTFVWSKTCARCRFAISFHCGWLQLPGDGETGVIFWAGETGIAGVVGTVAARVSHLLTSVRARSFQVPLVIAMGEMASVRTMIVVCKKTVWLVDCAPSLDFMGSLSG